ncbi:MAG: hypothetical protein GEU75_07150 [Dehalococcoidia bacterium]|nr:hypothetical protein [Dehalococcoidia bacterium]
MIAQQFLRQYAYASGVEEDVAQLEIVLTYALQRIGELGLWRRLALKGGTSLRKTVFGTSGRFSQGIDLLATDQETPNVEDALVDGLTHEPFHGLTFNVQDYRYSQGGNFGVQVSYQHAYGRGVFELQVSHRSDLVLSPVDAELLPQSYFPRLEFRPGSVTNVHRVEMLAEKVLACARRLGGSGKDVYDLYQYAQRPFEISLLRSLVCAKAWTDGVQFDPDGFLARLEPRAFNWTELRGLLGRGLLLDQAQACRTVQERLASLRELTALEQRVLADTTYHRDHAAYGQLADEARSMVG